MPKKTPQITRRAALASRAPGGDQLTKLQRQFTAVSLDAAVKAGIHGLTIKTGGRGFISATYIIKPFPKGEPVDVAESN